MHYADRMHKSQTTREQTIKVGLSFRETERRLNAKLFLDKYPRWEIGVPHQSVSSMRCYYMLPNEGRRRWRGSSAKAARAAYQGLTQEWTNLP